MRIERHRRKENDDGLLQCIRSFDRNVECRIVESALCTLHPVHDAAIAGRGSTRPSHGNTRIEVSVSSFVIGSTSWRHTSCEQRSIFDCVKTIVDINCRRQDFIRHGRRFHRRPHVVDTHDVCSVQDAGNHRGQRTVETSRYGRVFASAPPAEVRPTNDLREVPASNGKPSWCNWPKIGQQRIVFFEVLAKSKARIQHDRSPPDAAVERDLRAVGKVVHHHRDDIGRVRANCATLRPSARMHQDHATPRSAHVLAMLASH